MHGLFEESSKQQSAESGLTPVEAKREFVKVTLQMVRLDSALMGAEKPTFAQSRHAVDARHGDVCRIVAVGDDRSLMGKSVRRKLIVATPAIRHDRRATLDRIANLTIEGSCP